MFIYAPKAISVPVEAKLGKRVVRLERRKAGAESKSSAGQTGNGQGRSSISAETATPKAGHWPN